MRRAAARRTARVAAPLAAGLAALLALAAPLAAAAAEGGHAEGGIDMHFVWEWVNLLLLAGVLVYFARRPVLSYLGDRRSRIEGDLASAAKLLADAEARLADWNARAARLEVEVEEIRRAAREAAEAEGERILADARAVAERIQRDAQSVLERELHRARTRLRREVAGLSVQIAEKLLREQLQASDRARLVDEFVTRIERSAGGRAEGRA